MADSFNEFKKKFLAAAAESDRKNAETTANVVANVQKSGGSAANTYGATVAEPSEVEFASFKTRFLAAAAESDRKNAKTTINVANNAQKYGGTAASSPSSSNQVENDHLSAQIASRTSSGSQSLNTRHTAAQNQASAQAAARTAGAGTTGNKSSEDYSNQISAELANRAAGAGNGNELDDAAYKAKLSALQVQEREAKLTELQGKVSLAQQQEGTLRRKQQQLETAWQGLEKLAAQYQETGDNVTAQAYLMAKSEYDTMLADYQKSYETYEKNAEAYSDYQSAYLQYQKAYTGYEKNQAQYEQDYENYLDEHPETKYAGAQIQTLEKVLESMTAEKNALIQTGKTVDWDAVEALNGKIETVEGMLQTKKNAESGTQLWGSSFTGFLDGMLSAIQAGQLDWFSGMEQVDRKIGNAALGLAADWLGGVAKIIGSDSLLKTSQQWKEQSHSESNGAKEAQAGSQQAMAEALAGTGKVDGWIIQQFESIGSMMMDSYMMGAAELIVPGGSSMQNGKVLGIEQTQTDGTLKQMATKAWNKLDPTDGLNSLKIMSIRASGNAMLEAQQEGKSETEQLLIGIANGALEYVSEKMFGGNSVYDVDKGWVTKAVEKLTKNPTILRLMYSKGFDLFGEGIEEVFAGITEPIAEGLITGDEIEITGEELLNSFAGGVFLSLVGEGSNVFVREVSGMGHRQRAAERQAGQLVQTADAVQELVNKGLAADQSTEAYRMAEKLQKKLDNGRTISNREVGQQLFANQDAIEAGMLIDETEVSQEEHAPEGALHDPEDGVYAIGIVQGGEGKKAKTMYQLLQVTEEGGVRIIGEPTDGLLAAKLGAEIRGMNVRYISDISSIRESMLADEDVYIAEDEAKNSGEEERIATPPTEARNDSVETEERVATEPLEAYNDGVEVEERIATEPSVPRNDSTETEEPGLQWAGNEQGERIATTPAGSRNDSAETVERIAMESAVARNDIVEPEVQIATEPVGSRNDSIETNENSGLQWAGNQNDVEVMNYETEQTKQRNVGAGTDQQGQHRNANERTEKSKKRRRINDTVGRAGEASRIRGNAQASPSAAWIGLKQLGVQDANPDCFVTDLTEDAWTDRVKDAARIAEEADLIFTPVVGVMEIMAGDEIVSVDGILERDTGELFVRADSNKAYIDEIVRHEVFHELANRDRELVGRIREYLLETYTEKQLEEKIKQYYQRCQEVYSGRASTETLVELAYEELFADAYAEYTRYENSDAAELTEKVQKVVQERNGQRSGKQERGARYSFAGESSRTANLNTLQQAKEMRQQNVAAETIFRETGWYVGADGKWRYEIDDSSAEFRKDGDARLMQETGYQRLQELTQKWANSFDGGEELTADEQTEMDTLQDEYEDRVWEDKYMLTDFLKHDELFGAYPRLRGVSLIFDELPGGTKGFYSRKSNTIVLSSELFGKETDVLIHELQHVLQKYEEFTGGASIKYWNDRMEQGFSKKGSHGFEMMPSELYRNTAGEIEARDAAERRTLTWEERRNRMPNTGDADTVFAKREDAEWITAENYDSETASIKQQLENAKYRLNEMQIVKSVEVPTNLRKKDTAAKWAVEMLKRTGFKVDRQGYGLIYFSQKDIDKGLRYADTAEEKAAIILLPHVLKRGIEIGDHGNHKQRNKQTITFAAPVEMNGQRGNMAVVINRHGNAYYAHRIVLPDGRTFKFAKEYEDAAQELSGGVTENGSLAETTSAASRASITDSDETVNTKYSVSSEDKAQQTAERELAKGIGEIMQMPKSAISQLRNGIVRELIEEYRQTGELNSDKLQDLAATAFAQGLSINDEYYQRYKELKNQLRTTAVTISEQDKADIADYTQFKKKAFGTLRIVNQGGIPVDSLYQELRETTPELFPADITHPADQLVKLYEVAREIKRVETPLERALGEQADQFYDWAEKKIETLAERVLTKYADSVSWKQTGNQNSAGWLDPTLTPEEWSKASERMQQILDARQNDPTEARREAWKDEMQSKLSEKTLPPGVEPPLTEDEMDDELKAAITRSWEKYQAREKAKQEEREFIGPVDPLRGLVVPKRSFTSTPAMDKLGIKIDGSITRYRETKQLRAYDNAARKTQQMLNRRMNKLNATEQERDLARMLVKGEITADMLNQDKVNLDTVTELADYIGAAESFNNDRLSQRRAEINVGNLQLAQRLLKDSDEYAPRLKGKAGNFTKLVMNERTPERVVKQIFGDRQGEKIYETYFRPVWVNGSEMNRFENRMLQRVAEFEDQNGLKRQLTVEERAMAQRLLEGEAVRVRMDEIGKNDQTLYKRIEEAARDTNNGKYWEDASRDHKLYEYEEDYRGLVQAYADYMDTVTVSESMDQTILKNAVQEYQTVYNELYEAINDFLVSHGYHEIGFIKGYAPHFQKAEVQRGLFGALKNLGVEKENVSALPTEIAGRTADFKPNMKWNPHMQSRKGSNTDYDIAEGFQRYIHYAAEMFYHTDDVMRVRQAVNFMRKQFSAEDIAEEIEDARIDSYKDVAWKRNFLRQKGKLSVMGDQTDAEVNQAYQEYVDKLLDDIKPESLRKYSEFTSWMDNYANILAGKQSYADRGTEYSVDRNALNLGSKVMRAFSSANVAGNLSSVLNQTAQLPLIKQEVGGRWVRQAVWDMMRGDLTKESFAERSDFLTDKRGVDKLTTDNYEKVISAMFKPAEIMDRLVSTIAVRGQYLKSVNEGKNIDQAMKEADDFGRRVMGSRMKGAKPLAFESKRLVSQMIHVFQVEASNTFDYMMVSDMPQAVKEVYEQKGKGAAARYVAATATGYLLNAFVLNAVADALYGGSPAPFDLLGWILNFVAGGWGMDDMEFIKTVTDNGWEQMFGTRLFGTEPLDKEEGLQWAGSVKDLAYNILGDVPYVRNVMGVAGLGDQSMPTIGINDMLDSLMDAGNTIWQQATEPEETGLTWAGAMGRVGQDLFDVATELIPGGRQLQKTATGIEAMIRGGKYSGYGESSSLKYPIDQNVWNAIRAGLFGLSALPESDQYYAGGTALTAAQTAKVQALEEQGIDIAQTYGLYQEFADINKRLSKERIDSTEARKLKRETIDELKLTDAQKLEVYLETMASSSELAREKYEALLENDVTWQQLTQLDNDFASFNADSDGDGVDDLTSLEKGIAKRNAINDMDLNDWQKLEVFDRYQLDRDSENYETTRAEFEAMLNEGLNWDDITQAHNMYATLNADKELNATQKATEYAKWADEQGWNEEQKAAIKERYTFWQMIPAEASTYEKFTGAGLSSESSEKVTKLLGALEPEGDRDSVSISQKVLAIDQSQDLTAKEKTAAIAALAQDRQDRLTEKGVTASTAQQLAASLAIAEAEHGEDTLSYMEKARIVVDGTKTERDTMAGLSAVLNEDTYTKVTIANEYGVQAKNWVTFREEWTDRYGDASMSQEKVEDVLDRMNLTDRERAVLWQIANKSWKPKNNPYDRNIGELVYEELN